MKSAKYDDVGKQENRQHRKCREIFIYEIRKIEKEEEQIDRPEKDKSRNKKTEPRKLDLFNR
jgi:hypothetical protein